MNFTLKILGGIGERELEKLKAEADRLGKSSFAFAFYMDRQKEEREKAEKRNATRKEGQIDEKRKCKAHTKGRQENNNKIEQEPKNANYGNNSKRNKSKNNNTYIAQV